ncbi:hypothetical protein [Oceaniglobus indicus]|uniref:hypothetical protein n=1 Tax=Oceaniglobus indicus TaxID=2047749 RepID=UPI000C196A30|nr:hypothetical protein [Oceaniglobus indicus]
MGGGSQINRFAVKREVHVRSGDRDVIFAETSAEAEATPDLFALAEQAMSTWPGTWAIAAVRATPVTPPRWGNAPRSPAEYQRRVCALCNLAEDAGILGTEHLRHIPAGWLSVLECAMAGLSDVMRQPEHRPIAIRITQIKEKFGTLRFYVETTGRQYARARVGQIKAWAELCSAGRCMLTGMPGRLRKGSWMLTLSDEALRLRDADPEAFAARIHPAIP